MVGSIGTNQGRGSIQAERDTGNAGEGVIYRVGGWAAAGIVLLVLVNGPILMLNPIPTTVLGHLQQIQQNKLVGLVDLDLVMLISELLMVAVFVALFMALRTFSRYLVTAATGIALGSAVLYVAVNPTFSMLYLSDQYAAATSDAARASFLAAAEASWANYQGSAFGVSYVLLGVVTLILASIMLRSHAFSRWTAYAGLLTGALTLVPPLPALGDIAVVVSYLSLLPMIAWEVLLARGLFRLAKRGRAATESGGAIRRAA